MKTLFTILRMVFLGVLGLMFAVAGAGAVVDAAILLRANAWPHVPATIEQCGLTLRSGKQNYYWEVDARFRYGAGRTYDTQWQPDNAPTYAHDTPMSVIDEQRAALTVVYCDNAEIDGLRVSETFPGIARRNEEVMDGEWKRSLVFGLLMVIMGIVMIAMGIGPFRSGGKGDGNSGARRQEPQPAPDDAAAAPYFVWKLHRNGDKWIATLRQANPDEIADVRRAPDDTSASTGTST
ncbi:DUF3592 domain-containing protein [Burkholderia pseudomultivorans]|uniref:DUF3592 domain-containing protein n=1 Tax=Burkholderia pseudomultivorans TaxID=1207504 RepID=A0ABU2E442_9BURK|nr:DUF3592 domain-containing protein [Burkholderia pseudomultivorans]MDR8728135.1 hypothetical protein [Burkholderia pseudomultivorans]MDR8737159.1 hypothetical protein [Burkholderia pseudomultivorans]MDR8740286.1 hypothetical protein [Burkholderia pseudomultivorans]MDR8754630.1 hypothetical protein [Burkholderia pseudomultivorans]MDR8776700.1 hypothetical protein [Burkholderia pseudomultivorans]